MFCNILLLNREFIACDSSSASYTYTIIEDGLEVVILALLGDYKSSAIVLELDNPAIKFKAIIRGKLLIVLSQEFSFLELLLLKVSKGLVPKEEYIISLEAYNTKV